MRLQSAIRMPKFALGRTLDRYLLREWLRVFLVTLIGFPILVIVIDLTDKLDQYLSRGVSRGAVALSYVYDLPEKMFLVLPLFLAAGAALLAGLLLGEIAPVATSRRLEMLGEKAIRSTTSRFNFVYRADRGWVYAIRSLELRMGEMTDVLLEREGTGPAYPTIILAAQRAVYADTGKAALAEPPDGAAPWTLHRGTLRYLAGSQPGGEVAFEFDSLRSRTLRERPVDLLAEPKSPDEMRYAELRRYIEALTRSGSNAKKLQVELALKIAIPFICLFITLFGAPLAISTPKSGAAWGVAASLATTFIVLLMFQLAKAIGAGGVLPPLLAAWAPNILVGVAAVYLLRKAPT